MQKNINAPLVVITGASSGIGASSARRFAKEGSKVVLLARRKDKLRELHKEIGKGSIIIELDIQDNENVKETISSIEKDHGPIDVLINNAGCAFGMDPAYKCSIDEWGITVDTNIKGLLYCTHAVLPEMVKRNRGHIINIGSVAGTYPYPGGNVYGATKAFVHQFTLNLRADLLGTQVRVSCIEPGLVEGTNFSVVRYKGDMKRAEKVYENTKPLHADDVAHVIYFTATLPPHVNINALELMPVMQAFGPMSIYRETK